MDVHGTKLARIIHDRNGEWNALPPNKGMELTGKSGTPFSSGDSRLASQSIPTSNQVFSWLKEMDSLRKLLPGVSSLPVLVGN